MRTNYKNYIPVTEYRKYQQINNEDGTISFQDQTQYSQTGDKVSAEILNELSRNAVWPLSYAKSGTIHQLTGLVNASGTVTAAFTSSSVFAAGDSIAIDGETYIIQLAGGGTPKNGLFAANVTPLVVVDKTAKTITFQSASVSLTASDVGADPAGSASTVQTNLTNHANNTTIHTTAAEKTAWNTNTVHTLGYSKSGTQHRLTGLNGLSGTLSCVFKATAAFNAGDTFTVDGTAYTVQLSNGEAAEDNLFVNGATVAVVVDTAGKKINFKAGGGKKRLVTEIIAWTKNWVCPTGVTKVNCRIFGGGASGGIYGGGGGGHMAYSELNVTPGTSYPVTIGKGGAKRYGSSYGYNGGASSFSNLLSASGGGAPSTSGGGNGGSGGGGGWNSGPLKGGDATYGGGGGGCGGSYGSTSSVGSAGGNGGTYGGGGGSGGSGYSSSNGYSSAAAGTGGTYGGNGGKGGSKSAYPTAAQNGTNTIGMDLEFTGTGTAGAKTNAYGHGGAGGGGYGGKGGKGSAAVAVSASTTTDYYGGGAGGGGGYGGNGGNSIRTVHPTSTTTFARYASPGGGGGGFGADGGNGYISYDPNNSYMGAGGGGGYGPSGKGGDGYWDSNDTSGATNGGIAAGSGGGSGNGIGGDGICILTYYM